MNCWGAKAEDGKAQRIVTSETRQGREVATGLSSEAEEREKKIFYSYLQNCHESHKIWG